MSSKIDVVCTITSANETYLSDSALETGGSTAGGGVADARTARRSDSSLIKGLDFKPPPECSLRASRTFNWHEFERARLAD